MLPLLALLAACTVEPEYPDLGPQLYADQEGQEIHLFVEIFEGGDPGLEARFDVVNTAGDDDRFVLKRHRFDPELADDQGVACVGGHGLVDTADPDAGACEGETPSCTGDCLQWYGFIVTDPCQDPGMTAYELRLAGEEDAITVESFYVVDFGAECEGGSCSVLPAPASITWLGLAGMMLMGWRRRYEPGSS